MSAVNVRTGKPLPPGVVAGQPVNAQGSYFAADGTFMNADGTRSIFDDVDEDGSEPWIGVDMGREETQPVVLTDAMRADAAALAGATSLEGEES